MKLNINKIVSEKLYDGGVNFERKHEVVFSRPIWPDVDGPEEVNKFLEGLGIKVSFLLDSGIKFSYDFDKFDSYRIGDETLYLKDPITKNNLFHYYEGIGELVFENLITMEKFTIPIYDEWAEI